MSSSSVDIELYIGDMCQVLWRDGPEKLLAKIIETRIHHGKRQYYVHYVHHDRRLDEWIGQDKFLLGTLTRATPEPDSENLLDNNNNTNNNSNHNNSKDDNPTDPRKLRKRKSSPTSDMPSLRMGGGGGGGGNWHGSGGDPSLAALEREHEETTKVKNISKIIMGGWEVEAWYFSPYPDEYAQEDVLHVCEYCLKYMRKRRTFQRHRSECKWRKPPGQEIYRHDAVSVYEVDGKDSRVYCQNLCLLAKLFLDHKTLYYDVDPFYFYIICQVDEFGSHIVGYFSKEKVSAEDYNLACILTFPQYQQCGFGKFIISLSYELTKREHKTGSPEKPLSDLGKISYRSYWTHVLLNLLNSSGAREFSIKDMSSKTGIKSEDIISTLQSLDMIKCWKGQHVIFVKQKILDNYQEKNKQFRLCHSEYLNWEPPSQRTKE